MDKQSITGIVLIALILIVFSYFNKPKENLKNTENFKKDTLVVTPNNIEKKDTANKVIQEIEAIESVNNVNEGAFSNNLKGDSKSIIIENNLISVNIASKGAIINKVKLKRYKTFEGKDLFLTDEENNKTNLKFFAENRLIETKNIFFETINYTKNTKTTKSDSIVIGFRAYADSSKKLGYIEFLYKLKEDDYTVDFSVKFVGLEKIIPQNINYLTIDWESTPNSLEKSLDNERLTSTVYYKYLKDEADWLSETNDDKETLNNKVKWIAFKQHFFSSVLVAKDNFINAEIKINKINNEKTRLLKEMYASISIPYQPNPNNEYQFDMFYYFGPNHYGTLTRYNLEFEKMIPLGWGILGWINRFAVIPVFNFLSSFNINYGIIILIFTILVKIILFPIAYKTYLSSAKMKILKPEIDEINAKFGTEEPLKKQQAVMSLYKRAGVNPMAGCVPMLLQFPILIALFRFFPASIELRQESFLWADDLSSYDSIYDLGFNIPFYGDHVSLFTILMTISTIIYTKLNSDSFGSNNQMPGMKIMMYAMPIMFLGIFNNYSSGLSYYYFLANVLTFGQQFAIKGFIDEDKLHKQIQENKKRPIASKKSSFQKRLEDMAKKKGYKK
ncbi:MAG: hypothetical protein A2X12_04215 [Bacteroidetes bacterium GWE2_29_8]|nr:MAG: hypothetical protein A2X12_04215 [Bacteroidetes bacterium GWE2_29_8]OFY24984.1 MAG: hypothetical protein A2X02_08055 [Bacteroidetes bacterium GWF2_29_10]